MTTENKRFGYKHLISCRCSLPQFKERDDPPFHKFLVFSVIDENDVVEPKFAQCNNCGIVHRVTDICTSTIVNKEDIASITSIDDIKLGLNDKLVATLERYNVDIATWEAVQFIIENECWGERVILTSDDVDGEQQVKYIVIMGRNIFKVVAQTCEVVI